MEGYPSNTPQAAAATITPSKTQTPAPVAASAAATICTLGAQNDATATREGRR